MSSSPSPKLIVHHLQIGQGERIPWLLEELGIPYELRLYQRSPILAPPELKALYPIGASPVLEDLTSESRPVKFAESGAIAEYIVHRYGGGRLAVSASQENFAEYCYWFHFANATLQAALFARMMARAQVGEGSPGFQSSTARVQVAVQHVNKRLLESDWLAGEELTAADIMTGWCFTTMRKFEPIDLTGYEGVLAWLKRIGQRDAYRRAMSKSDPELDIEQGLSAKGPPIMEAWAKFTGVKQ